MKKAELSFIFFLLFLEKIEPEAIGPIVGRKGAKLKEFNEKYNVTIDVRKSRKSLRIQGESFVF